MIRSSLYSRAFNLDQTLCLELDLIYIRAVLQDFFDPPILTFQQGIPLDVMHVLVSSDGEYLQILDIQMQFHKSAQPLNIYLRFADAGRDDLDSRESHWCQNQIHHLS